MVNVRVIVFKVVAGRTLRVVNQQGQLSGTEIRPSL